MSASVTIAANAQGLRAMRAKTSRSGALAIDADGHITRSRQRAGGQAQLADAFLAARARPRATGAFVGPCTDAAKLAAAGTNAMRSDTRAVDALDAGVSVWTAWPGVGLARPFDRPAKAEFLQLRWTGLGDNERLSVLSPVRRAAVWSLP